MSIGINAVVPNHTSVSALRDAMRCFYLYAATRVFRGLPPVKLMENVAYGIIIHSEIDTLGKACWAEIRKTNKPIKSTDFQGIINTAVNKIARTLGKSQGPRTIKGQIQEIQWFDDGKPIAEKIQSYQGRLYNALHALRLQFTEPLPFVNLEFEKSFTIPLQLGDWQWVAEGRIDILEFLPDGYTIGDYKSGVVTKLYDNYVHSVEDIQFTMYSEVMTREIGSKPEAMFVQPLDFSSDFLKREGSKALSRLRKSLPQRANLHFKEVTLLAKDVHDVITSVVHPDKFTTAERLVWQGVSAFGQMDPSFAESIQQRRFIPTPTEGCKNSCMHHSLCKRENPDIWERYEANRQVPKLGVKPVAIKPLPIAEQSVKMPLLEGIGGITYKVGQNLPKVDQLSRKAWLSTGQFISRGLVKITGFGVIYSILEVAGCECYIKKIVPRWLFRYLDPTYDPKREHFGHLCNIDGCKFQNKSCACS